MTMFGNPFQCHLSTVSCYFWRFACFIAEARVFYVQAMRTRRCQFAATAAAAQHVIECNLEFLIQWTWQWHSYNMNGIAMGPWEQWLISLIIDDRLTCGVWVTTLRLKDLTCDVQYNLNSQCQMSYSNVRALPSQSHSSQCHMSRSHVRVTCRFCISTVLALEWPSHRLRWISWSQRSESRRFTWIERRSNCCGWSSQSSRQLPRTLPSICRWFWNLVLFFYCWGLFLQFMS